MDIEAVTQELEDIQVAMDKIEAWLNNHDEKHPRDEEAYQKIVKHCERIKEISIAIYEYNKIPYKNPEQQKLC